MVKIKINFWGVRGSTPSISPDTIKYGGNTPCVEILYGNERIICDAGTGIQRLGAKIVKSGKKVRAIILLSHIHWDHISGLSFFEPFFYKKNEFTIMGPGVKGKDIKGLLSKAISPPYFPVGISDFAATVRFKTVAVEPFRIGSINVVPHGLSHPGGAIGWRFNFQDGRSLVYVSDNEPGKGEKAFLKWIKGADILIHDAQYTPAEYKKKTGWGHSPYTYPIKVAMEAGVKKLFLSHFNPPYPDKKLEEILKNSKKIIKRSGVDLECFLARENG